MKQIESNYIINKETLAILPAKQIEYHSVVMEGDQTVFVRQTPLELVKAACLANWCTYEGRRQAVMHHTGFKRKVPIPISIYHGIFTFPTHAQTSIHCSWIFYEHMLGIEEANNTKGKKSIITFKNNRMLTLDISMHILKTQMQRTLECIYKTKR